MVLMDTTLVIEETETIESREKMKYNNNNFFIYFHTQMHICLIEKGEILALSVIHTSLITCV